MIELIIKQEVVDSVPARWLTQYPLNHHNTHSSKREIGYQLIELVPPLNVDEVNRIIGNKSWTSMNCDQCGNSVDKLVEIGHDNSEYACPRFCLDCLTTAVMLAKGK